MLDMKAVLTSEAQTELDRLSTLIKVRIFKIFHRLQAWPNVSGVKPLRGNLVGMYRLRTGDYRIQFLIRRDKIVVVKIGHRDGFYGD